MQFGKLAGDAAAAPRLLIRGGSVLPIAALALVLQEGPLCLQQQLLLQLLLLLLLLGVGVGAWGQGRNAAESSEQVASIDGTAAGGLAMLQLRLRLGRQLLLRRRLLLQILPHTRQCLLLRINVLLLVLLLLLEARSLLVAGCAVWAAGRGGMRAADQQVRTTRCEEVSAGGSGRTCRHLLLAASW